MKERALYIHIPFCVKKCNYCDFVSFRSSEKDIDRYLLALEKEMIMYNIKKEKIRTIFIGGGTPTILSEVQLKKLFEIIARQTDLSLLEEYTIEANPGTLNQDKLKIIKEAGVNRLSIGLQAVQERNLKFMGRLHSLKDFEKTYSEARQLGFDNINIDLIFAFHGQTLDDWKETLEYVIDKNPEHISVYSLIIEEGTNFYKKYEKGEIEDFDEELYVKMYRFAKEYLSDNSYEQYEISNFSKKDFQCRHNIKYWECEEYFGVGISASGYLNEKRYTNMKNFEKYIQVTNNNILPIDFQERLTKVDIFNEKIMLGLRMDKGIDFSLIDNIEDEVLKKNIKKTIEKYEKKRYIEVCKDDVKKIIKLTQSGKEISNSIILDLIF